MKAEKYSKRQEQVGRWKVNIVSYKLGDQYYCTVDNVEPGATLARGQGSTREEAEKKALERAKELLAKTRVVV
jgi:dsRNA-specific ribonuclease